MHLSIYLLLLLLLELLYFRVAKRFRIIDKPNQRSSHSGVVLRGGGIIFLFASWIWFIEYRSHPYFIAALSILSIISFMDDIRSIPSLARLFVQLLSLCLLIFDITFSRSIYYSIPLFLLFIAAVNAYNFMDGINGITAMYSIVSIVTLLWANRFIIQFFNPDFYNIILASLAVFSFFNVRSKAKCFAGDVGSVSMATIVCFGILLLSIMTSSWLWILLLGIYGIDSGFTLICRISRREKIFQAHRSHFYQYLANEKKVPHVIVSGIYAASQLALNIVVIISYHYATPLTALSCLFAIIVIYIIFRFRYEGVKRLFELY